MKKVPVIKQDEQNIVEQPILAQAIVEMSRATKKALSTRLTTKAIITLIAHESKLPRRDIEIVINNLLELENTWLKK